MKLLKSIFALLISGIVLSCYAGTATAAKSDTIRVTVTYPYADDKKFDNEYYAHTHLSKVLKMPLVKGLEYTLGMSGPAPDSKPPYFAVFGFTYKSLEDFQTSFGSKEGQAAVADIKNFTDVAPVIVVGKLVKVR